MFIRVLYYLKFCVLVVAVVAPATVKSWLFLYPNISQQTSEAQYRIKKKGGKLTGRVRSGRYLNSRIFKPTWYSRYKNKTWRPRKLTLDRRCRGDDWFFNRIFKSVVLGDGGHESRSQYCRNFHRICRGDV